MKQNSRLSIAVLCVLISAKAAPGQSPETRIPFPLDKPILEPTVFAPNEISTGDYESHPEFTLDGKTLYFLKSTPDFNFWTIVFSRFENGKWGVPRVAPFSGQYSDADEFITGDGKRMFFISRRPVSRDVSPNAAGKLDIWLMDKTAAGAWSAPRNLGAPVNSEGSEFFPTLTKDDTLYFGSGRQGGKGGIDLYSSRFVNGRYREPENLGDAINTTFDEFEPYIAPDESFLIFMAAGRPDGLGGFDLFISYNRDGKWTKAQNLGAPINSAADELSPKITRDRKYFFWTSTRSVFSGTRSKPFASADFFRTLRGSGNGLGDIYYLDTSVLKIEPRSEQKGETMMPSASSEIPNGNTIQKEAAMTTRASGTFEVKLTSQDDKTGDPTLGRITIEKQFHGDLEGTSKGQMLTAGPDVNGSGVYVAIEKVSGTLHGRRGTFLLHHTGVMTRGAPQLTITVVPDSGTGELKGIAGKMTIEIVDGKHSFTLDYKLGNGQ